MTVKERIEALSGISYSEWRKIEFVINESFRVKKGELEHELKLSQEDLLVIQKQFG